MIYFIVWFYGLNFTVGMVRGMQYEKLTIYQYYLCIFWPLWMFLAINDLGYEIGKRTK